MIDVGSFGINVKYDAPSAIMIKVKIGFNVMMTDTCEAGASLRACANKNFDQALELQMQLLPLHRALFLEPSPAGIKYACSVLGLNEPVCRLPIVELRDIFFINVPFAPEGLAF